MISALLAIAFAAMPIVSETLVIRPGDRWPDETVIPSDNFPEGDWLVRVRRTELDTPTFEEASLTLNCRGRARGVRFDGADLSHARSIRVSNPHGMAVWLRGVRETVFDRMVIDGEGVPVDGEGLLTIDTFGPWDGDTTNAVTINWLNIRGPHGFPYVQVDRPKRSDGKRGNEPRTLTVLSGHLHAPWDGDAPDPDGFTLLRTQDCRNVTFHNTVFRTGDYAQASCLDIGPATEALTLRDCRFASNGGAIYAADSCKARIFNRSRSPGIRSRSRATPA